MRRRRRMEVRTTLSQESSRMENGDGIQEKESSLEDTVDGEPHSLDKRHRRIKAVLVDVLVVKKWCVLGLNSSVITMVVVDYENMHVVYEEMRQAVCGRQACSVMILVANEVDAMASSKILTHLLRNDSIAYKLRPIANFGHVLQTIEEFRLMDIKIVFMINCGAIYNIPKLFGLNHGEVRCFLLDNHRPLHLANVYSRYNVVVLDDGSIGADELPSDGSDLSEDDDDDDENDDDDDDDDSNGDADDKIAEVEQLAPEDLSDAESEDEFTDDEEHSTSLDKQPNEVNELETNNDSLPVDELSPDETLPKEVETSDLVVDDEEAVVGKKRKALSKMYDPIKHRVKKLRSYYSRGDSYSAPTAVMLINLVKNLNKSCTPDILWSAILGVTDQFQRNRITELLYNAICDEIKRELPEGSSGQKYTVGSGSEEVVVTGAETGHICSGLEYRFFMYRHWSLYEAMWNSTYLAAKLLVWKTQGTLKLQEMLAKMGVPLQQCKQSYTYMTPSLRYHFRQQIVSEVALEYGLKDPSAVYKSFYRYNSFKNPVAAADIVNAVTALIEMGGDENIEAPQNSTESITSDLENENGPTWIKFFNDGYDCLGMKSSAEAVLKRGIALALSLQRAIVGQAAAMLERHDAITRLKCFRYSIVSRSSGGSTSDAGVTDGSGSSESIFGRPAVLSKLAHFLLTVQTENGAWAGKRAKPLVLAAEKQNTYLVVGVVPPNMSINQSGIIPKNNFRKLFTLAAEETHARSRNDGIDTSIIEIDKEDVHTFLENLMFLMTS